jgi:hypothetical protein
MFNFKENKKKRNGKERKKKKRNKRNLIDLNAFSISPIKLKTKVLIRNIIQK